MAPSKDGAMPTYSPELDPEYPDYPPGTSPPRYVHSPWQEDCLTKNGATKPHNPFHLVPGTPHRPGLAAQGDESTGVYWPALGAMGISLFKAPRFEFWHRGLLMMTPAGFGGFLGPHEEASGALQDWQLPSRSGVLLAAGDLVTEVFAGDGSEDEFTLADPAVPGSVRAFVAGLRVVDLALDVNGVLLTFGTPPANLAEVVVDYARA